MEFVRFYTSRLVASFTDAWIETLLVIFVTPLLWVASFTDAWIETVYQVLFPLHRLVASFTDAWIETGRSLSEVRRMLSRPSRTRGLKHMTTS